MTMCADDEAYSNRELKPCSICLQPKPCPCDTAPRTIGRPDVIPYLKHVILHEYDQGYNATCNAIEDAICELQRLNEISQAMHREIMHLREINQRLVKELVEIAPLKKYIISDEGTVL